MPTHITCRTCSKVFSIYPSTAKGRKYCSHACYISYKRKHPTTKQYTKQCEHCDIEFISNRKDARFCSLQCFGQSRKQGNLRTCPQCDKSFYRQPSHLDQFCSRECYDKHRKENADKICETCGKTFFTTIDMRNECYCSRECYFNRPLTGIWKPCKNCSEKFYVGPARAEREQFCSRDCRISYQGPTSIEQLLIDELETRDIEYEFQYKLNQWSIDFAFPNHKLAVEADGVYWHSLPENIERDKRKDRSLKRKDWTILRFTGDEIRESSTDCIDQVLAHIKD